MRQKFWIETGKTPEEEERSCAYLLKFVFIVSPIVWLLLGWALYSYFW